MLKSVNGAIRVLTVIIGLGFLTSVLANAATVSQGGYAVMTNCYEREFANPALPAAVPWRYCVTEEIGSRNKDVVFYLHGKGLSENAWSSKDYYGTQVQAEWHREHIPAPRVVAVSFGPIWLLVEKNTSPASGLLEVFSVIREQIEKEIGGIQGQRLLVGESMGGFNASQLLLKMPKLFKKVAVLCPAFVDLSPFSPKADLDAYIQRTKADPVRVEQMVMLSQYFMPTPADWAKHSPIDLAQQLLTNKGPDVYLSCAKADEYGFYEGALKFLSIARKNNTHIVFRDLWGGHCTVDVKSVARFLAN